MADLVCNVFISHIHEDDKKLGAMKELLKKNGCQARDSSVHAGTPNNASNESYIKHQILAPRIEWAGTVVVLITPDTKHSSWVQWEIDYAQRHNKRIVGVWDNGEKGCDIPQALDDYASAIVPWRADQIIGAIFGEINNWRLQDGTPMPPRAEAPRYSCA